MWLTPAFGRRGLRRIYLGLCFTAVQEKMAEDFYIFQNVFFHLLNSLIGHSLRKNTPEATVCRFVRKRNQSLIAEEDLERRIKLGFDGIGSRRIDISQGRCRQD